jgi:hypothetical protein
MNGLISGMLNFAVFTVFLIYTGKLSRICIKLGQIVYDDLEYSCEPTKGMRKVDSYMGACYSCRAQINFLKTTLRLFLRERRSRSRKTVAMHSDSVYIVVFGHVL